MKLLAVLLLVSLPTHAGDLVARDAWIRAAPPSASVLAGYATLDNTGRDAVTIVGGTSTGFARVELHEMRTVDGVMRMRALDEVTIAPGATLELAPGARHLMLREPRRPLVRGARVDIELRLRDGRRFAATFVVR